MSPAAGRVGPGDATDPEDDIANAGVAEFLRDSLRHPRGEVVVVQDGGGNHEGDPIRELLAEPPRPTVERLPGYGPHLNPVEVLRAFAEYGRLANLLPKGVAEGDEKVRQALGEAKADPGRLRKLRGVGGPVPPPTLPTRLSRGRTAAVGDSGKLHSRKDAMSPSVTSPVEPAALREVVAACRPGLLRMVRGRLRRGPTSTLFEADDICQEAFFRDPEPVGPRVVAAGRGLRPVPLAGQDRPEQAARRPLRCGGGRPAPPTTPSTAGRRGRPTPARTWPFAN